MENKRDQINFILDPETRAALDEIMSAMQPAPSSTALMRHLILEKRASVKKKAGKERGH